MASNAHWTRSKADQAAMGEMLAPLVAASRPREFSNPKAASAIVIAFCQALEEVPRTIVGEAVFAMVSRGIVWFPKPGELKEECARIVGLKRKAAADRHLAECDHPRHFIEVEINGVPRMKRCHCWERAQQAMDDVCAPIALPPAQHELQDSQVW